MSQGAPKCNCNKGLDYCPTPYTCGIYHLEGHQEAFDLAEPITGPWDWITAPTKTLIAVAAVCVVALALAIF
jgi:hypothetical protein